MSHNLLVKRARVLVSKQCPFQSLLVSLTQKSEELSCDETGPDRVYNGRDSLSI